MTDPLNVLWRTARLTVDGVLARESDVITLRTSNGAEVSVMDLDGHRIGVAEAGELLVNWEPEPVSEPVELMSEPDHFITQVVPMSGWCLLACRCGWATMITPSPNTVTKVWDKHRGIKSEK